MGEINCLAGISPTILRSEANEGLLMPGVHEQEDEGHRPHFRLTQVIEKVRETIAEDNRYQGCSGGTWGSIAEIKAGTS